MTQTAPAARRLSCAARRRRMSCVSSKSISLKKNNKTHKENPVGESILDFNSGIFFVRGFYQRMVSCHRDAVLYNWLAYRGFRSAEGARFTPRLNSNYRSAVQCRLSGEWRLTDADWESCFTPALKSGVTQISPFRRG